jgi:hypothetical protein
VTKPVTDPRTLALALLAIPASVIVTVAEASGQFGPWEIPIGLLILLVTLSYEESIPENFLGSGAFSIMCGAGVLFVTGVFIDAWIGDLSHASARMTAGTRNWLMVGAWLAFSCLIFLGRSRLRAALKSTASPSPSQGS